MPLAQIARFLPAVMPLFGAAMIWSFVGMRAAYRKRGRREVERVLASRRETLVAIENLPFPSMYVRTGLTSTVIFRVRARSADGAEQTYEWAFEPRIFPWQTEGLKRCAHGVWIALA